MWKTLPNRILTRVIPALVLTSIEAFLSVICIFSGTGVLASPGNLAPSAALLLFPGFTIYLWGAGLTAGGALAFIGIALTEYRLERIGVLALMTTVGTFSLALVESLPQSFVSLLVFVLFTLAMAARYWVLGRLISIQKIGLRHLREHKNECGG